VAGVGEQREAVGNDAADDLDDQERRGYSASTSTQRARPNPPERCRGRHRVIVSTEP